MCSEEQPQDLCCGLVLFPQQSFISPQWVCIRSWGTGMGNLENCSGCLSNFVLLSSVIQVQKLK